MRYHDDQERFVDFWMTLQILDISALVFSSQFDLLQIILNYRYLFLDPKIG